MNGTLTSLNQFLLSDWLARHRPDDDSESRYRLGRA